METVFDFLKLFIPVASVFVAISAIMQGIERSRRELAVNLIYNWANDFDWATSRSVSLAKNIGNTAVKAIGAGKPASIGVEHHDAIVCILRTEFPQSSLPKKPNGDEKDFEISGEQALFMRYLWVRWLNRLEGTLAAWQQGAADSELMEEEFAPLVAGSEAELEVLAPVRIGLPVVDAFYDQQKENGRIKIKPKIRWFPWRP